jgi:hypothetical protein
VATFERQLSLGGPSQEIPPIDLAEENASNWAAWAQGASGRVEDDAQRKISGRSSIKFLTDGGFDTYVRYPQSLMARWDLTNAKSLVINFFAENNNLGFQSGSPWIRLKDADGNFFEYQFYRNGGVADILNDARNRWRSYEIPLDASNNVLNGWRRTTFGSPDLSRIQFLEIHSDTWEFGFNLWIDGVSFVGKTTGDYDLNAVVGASDIDRLFAAVRQQQSLNHYDLDNNRQVTKEDVDYLVENVLQTVFGDANLDGVFDSSDLVAAFQAGQYEDPLAANSTWVSGDWDGDLEFGTSDLVLAFQKGGYQAN